MVLHHFLSSPIFKNICPRSLYFDFEMLNCNTSCWYSGKDTGLSPGRPQFKPLHYQGFLQKDLPWKFFKKWLSIRRITVWITSRSPSLPTSGGAFRIILSSKNCAKLLETTRGTWKILRNQHIVSKSCEIMPHFW